jgi:hypothetical protein
MNVVANGRRRQRSSTRLAVPPVASATWRERLTPRAHFYAPKHVIPALDLRRYAALTETPPQGNGPQRPESQHYPTFALLATFFVDRSAGTPGATLFFPRGRRQDRPTGGARQPAEVAPRAPQRQARRGRARGRLRHRGRRREGNAGEAGTRKAQGHKGQGQGASQASDNPTRGGQAPRRAAEAPLRTAPASARAGRDAGRPGPADGRRPPGGEGRRGGAQDCGQPPAPSPRPLTPPEVPVTPVTRIGAVLATRAGYKPLK